MTIYKVKTMAEAVGKRTRKLTEKGEQYLATMARESFKRSKREFEKGNELYHKLGPELGVCYFEVMTRELTNMKECIVRLTQIGVESGEIEIFNTELIEIEQQLINLSKSCGEDRGSVISNKSKSSKKGRKCSSIVSRTSSVSSKKAELAAELAMLKSERLHKQTIDEADAEYAEAQRLYKDLTEKAKATLVKAKRNRDEIKLDVAIECKQAALDAVTEIGIEEDERSRASLSLPSEDSEHKEGLLEEYLADSRAYAASTSSHYSALPESKVECQQTSVRSKTYEYDCENQTETDRFSPPISVQLEDGPEFYDRFNEELGGANLIEERNKETNVFSSMQSNRVKKDQIGTEFVRVGEHSKTQPSLFSRKRENERKSRLGHETRSRFKPRPTYNEKPPSFHPTGHSQTTSRFNAQPDNKNHSGDLSQTELLKQFNNMQLKMVELFSKNQEKATLPVEEPEVFKGDLLSYPMWRVSFETLIEDKTDKPSQRLYYLGRYTGGEARAAIHKLIALRTQEAYDKAQSILFERYGNKFNVANAFRDKLEKWPNIQLHDGPGFLKFYDFLEQCKTAMETVEYLRFLNDPKENMMLLQKLPNNVAERWNAITTQRVEDSGGDYPSFREFTKFIGREARKACNPISSYAAIHGKQKEAVTKEKVQRTQRSKNIQRTSFLTKNDEVQSEPKKGGKDQTKKSGTYQTNDYSCVCVYCKENHDIEACKRFISLTLEKREEFCKNSRLCLACLRSGHSWKDCWYPRKCNQCSRWHPTLLHNDALSKIADAKYPLQDNKIVNKVVTRFTSSNINSMIVPVKITNKENDQTVDVYCILDDQSDTCFIEESLLDELNAVGENSMINLTTMLGQERIKCKKVINLKVQGLATDIVVDLPCVYSRQVIPARHTQIPRKETAQMWSHLKPIANKLYKYDKDLPIGLLIGANCPECIKPIEIVPGGYNEPYGKLTVLGWGIIGNVATNSNKDDCIVNRIICEEVQIGQNVRENRFIVPETTKEVYEDKILKLMQQDFLAGVHDEDTGLSVEDKRFLDIVKSGIEFKDNHYEVPLPLKNEAIEIPNNYHMAKKRLMNLRTKMLKNPQFKEDYCTFMNELFNNNYAEVVKDSEINHSDQMWFIPHYGVYHPHKPNKIRVVFDCSCKFKDFCLNENLLQGPDLTNNLVGILCRFRLYPVAFCCDIRNMFHQVLVKEKHRDLLRFLWFQNNDVNGPIVQYKMKVHVFGARSSPSVVNFVLKDAADKFRTEENQRAADFIKDDFYVDDGIKSVKSVKEAIAILKDSVEICKQGGFQLHKIISNHPAILRALCPKEEVQSVKSLDLTKEEVPVERTLGISWNTVMDEFQFEVKPSQKPNTRRGILSVVSSIFDPIGMISPFILKGKKILQVLCKLDLGWDDPIPEDIENEWNAWMKQLDDLEHIKIKRCYAPLDADIVEYQLHHFSDASEKGYGQCSYLHMTDRNGQVYTSLVMSKSRVSPIKAFTIPRLELTAALVSVKVSNFLKKELKIKITREIFWTDSTVVLGYICNENRRFKVFVANRVAEIRKYTSPDQWRYVTTDQNPADICSRGTTVIELSNSHLWWNGPEFLKQPNIVDVKAEDFELDEDDPEVKVCKVTVTVNDDILDRLEYFSDWTRARKSVALCLKYISVLRKQKPQMLLTNEDLLNAEKCIIKKLQKNKFFEDYALLTKKCSVSKKSSLYKLDPFIDDDGLIRVGGRLRRSGLDYGLKHPVILPKDTHVTNLIISHYHHKVHHQGRNITLNSIRSHGYWIVKGSTLVARLVHNCIICKKIRHNTITQKMSDLPKDRLEPSAPFTYSAVDYFGPFFIKEGRKEIKRYGVLFTCMSTRAVHLETANSLTTDAFINAYRRFICRRGPCVQLRCDHGTNFVGAERELNKCFNEMDIDKINNVLMKDNCEMTHFKLNPPNASHMGGVWERQIRSVRSILNVLLNADKIFDDEMLRTFMCEAENIINGRPLTQEVINDPFLEPLTPNHFLLTTKSKVVLPPPGNFVKNDRFSRKSWRRVQYLLEQFWKRWQKEYLLSLQTRQKWNREVPNVKIDDVVIVKDYTLPRNHWSLGKVVEVMPDDKGLVRKVKLMMPTKLNNKGQRIEPVKYLERPIHNLIVLTSDRE